MARAAPLLQPWCSNLTHNPSARLFFSSLHDSMRRGHRVSCRALSRSRNSYRHQTSTVAVLYQAISPPVINGVRKPPKPGGYQDSGADIAFVLKEKCNTPILTPKEDPDATMHEGWCFPDNEDGILSAIDRGATHLWANTILFASHPLQISQRLGKHAQNVCVVGQPPLLVEKFDDKSYLNDLLRSKGTFTLPQSRTVDFSSNNVSFLQQLKMPFPIVAKPIRGRGSHGVRLCHTLGQLEDHVIALSKESPSIMFEQYLAGEEGTVTVMPPSSGCANYWAMPFVTRFNHEDGIAPYNGVVAVTANSRTLTKTETDNDEAYAAILKECVRVAELLQAKAPIRIDVRRFTQDSSSSFCLFDINMKPNMTGPGRPGRENQASLTAMSAAALGWDYPHLLRSILESASSLQDLRSTYPPP